MKPKGLEVRGYLLHLTHYDPRWMQDKKRERPFHLGTALRIVRALKASGMNVLMIAVADAVVYRGHPELKRRYSAPLSHLVRLCREAEGLGLEVVPKLNFSKSPRNRHDEWLLPHADPVHWKSGEARYWKVAEDVLSQLCVACRPKRYFHIGMDEDHARSLDQFVRATLRLRGLLKRRGLKTLMWNDTSYEGRDVIAEVHADKCRAAEPLLPKDIVQVLWDYDLIHPRIVRRIVAEGFPCWVAPGRTRAQVLGWKRAALREGATGMLMTNWLKCSARNAGTMLKDIETLGPLYS